MELSVKEINKKNFVEGLRDGLPIGLGYFAVAFSLGIAAKNAGLDVFQGILASLLTNASAGEYAAFIVIAENAPYFQMVLMTLISNGRYMLMSLALNQKVSPETPIRSRLLIGFDVTDELFAISINRKDYLNPKYFYGAMITTIPLWALGTACGIIAGSVLSKSIVSALSVALYGMFIAVFVPQVKKDRIIGVLIITCLLFSYLFTIIPVLSTISVGTKTIILTILISSLAALICPIKRKSENQNE